MMKYKHLSWVAVALVAFTATPVCATVIVAGLLDAEMKLVDLRQTGTGQDGVRFGSRLISKMGYLSNGVSTSDFKPTNQAVEVQSLLTTENQLAIRELDALLKAELPSLNQMLEAKQLPMIVDKGGAPARFVP